MNIGFASVSQSTEAGMGRILSGPLLIFHDELNQGTRFDRCVVFKIILCTNSSQLAYDVKQMQESVSSEQCLRRSIVHDSEGLHNTICRICSGQVALR
jgi:hypothetical protein